MTRTRPFNAQEYIESLRDGREIWIYGERVKDVTTHPAFRNTVRMLARLYDALHDERKATLCMDTDTGSGGYTHKFFRASRNAEEMVGARDVWVDGPESGLQGRVSRHARREFRVLRAVRGKRQTLVQESAGGMHVRQSRHRESARRPQQAIGRSA